MKIIKISLIVLILLNSFNCIKQETTEPIISDKPNSPSPADGSLSVDINTVLSWQCANAVKYDIYFDTKNPPNVLIAKDTNSNKYSISGLTYGCVYYWKIVAKFNNGNQSAGNVWSFLTKNKTPSAPGYIMENYKIETQLPCFVNILLQVTDVNGTGIRNLQKTDFEIFEDYQSVSPTESALNIKKKETIPYTLKTVLMLDNSASVKTDLPEIKNAAITLVNSILPQQEIAIYKFSEIAELVQDFTNNTTALTNAINSINVGAPTTNLYGSVITGVNKWEDFYSTEEVNQGVLILLTDGSDTQGSNSLNDALGARGDKRVYTLGLGNEIDLYALQQLGNAGFFPVTDASLLAAKFLEIQNEMDSFANSFYWVNYMSPKRGNFNHILELKIKNNPNTGANSFITGNFNSNGFFSASIGVFINTSNQNPYGIDTLYLPANSNTELKATTYRGDFSPIYSWTSTNTNIVSVNYNPNLNSKCIATATGQPGEIAEIRVDDTANEYSKNIKVIILN